MKVLIVGDIVGEPGRDILLKYLDKNKQNYDFIVVNGENAAGGFGITERIANRMFSNGVDVITLGNHSWDRRDIYKYISEEKRLIRPYNFSKSAPGNGYVIIEKNGIKIAVLNIQGRVYMPLIDCPFKAIDEIVPTILEKTNILIVDFHAEATSEKQAMGWNLDGRASVVYGTHTHVQTADNRLLHHGTAYISDVGMTGGHDGVLGMNKRESIQKFKDGMPSKWIVCEDNTKINAIEVEIDEITGKSKNIERINLSIREI